MALSLAKKIITASVFIEDSHWLLPQEEMVLVLYTCITHPDYYIHRHFGVSSGVFEFGPTGGPVKIFYVSNTPCPKPVFSPKIPTVTIVKST